MRSLINSFIPSKRMSPPPPKSWGRAVVIPASKTDLPDSCKFVLALVIIFLVCFLSFWSFRSGSWAEPNSNRRPTQTIWTGWIDSDVAWFSDVRGRWRSLSLRREAKGTANDLVRLMIRLIIQTPILIPAELNSKGEKCSFRSNYLQNTL